MSVGVSKDAFDQQFTGLTQEDSDDSYLPDDDDDGNEKDEDAMSKTLTAQDMVKVGAKTMTAEVQPVESKDTDGGPGEFRLVLSKDNQDRDKENLWAFEWGDLPAKIHMDTDHAWAKGMSVPHTAGSGVPHIDDNGDLVVEGTYARTKHAQDLRLLVNDGHVWQASVSYLEHTAADGSITREILNGTFTGVPNNTECVVTSSKDMSDVDLSSVDVPVVKSKKSGGTTDGQYPASDGPFGDPKNKKWPLNTAQHVRTAWSYIHQPAKTVNYSPAEVAAIKGRIRSRARQLGVTLSDDKAMQSLAQLDAMATSLLKMKDLLAPWMLSQSSPGHTEAGAEVGAVSVYDKGDGDDDEDDAVQEDEDLSLDGDEPVVNQNGVENRAGNVLEWGDLHLQLAQSVHDMSTAIRDVAIKLGAQTKPNVSLTNDEQLTNNSVDQAANPVPADDWEYQGWGDKTVTLTRSGNTVKLIVGDEVVADGAVKHVSAETVLKAIGMPVGPYQGVTGMSGENAVGTTPGQAITNGQMFLGGTADPGNETLPPSTGETATAAGDTPAAAAASPADVAARAKTLAAARVRAFSHQMNARTITEE